MLVRQSGPASCPRALRRAHKRLDTEEPAAKSPRLSESAPDSPLLLPSAPLLPRAGSGEPARAPLGPSQIGQYLLLPSGDPGSAHGAWDTDTGEQLICKVFDMCQYQEKIRAYGVLPKHRNVAQIKDIILGERKAYVFQEKDFGDMHSLVKSCKRLPEEQALKLFYQIALAVAHCHKNGIVLGDLKLRKFVFTDEKRTHLKLEGLEDCRILDTEDDSVSDTLGCPAYVSPEILSGAGSYSGKRADAWSMGVMLYTMLTGRYPFHDSDPAALFSKIRRGAYGLPEGLSAPARCLVRSLLRREPSERLSAADVLVHPCFRGGAEHDAGDHEVNSTEQMVPQAQLELEEELFC